MKRYLLFVIVGLAILTGCAALEYNPYANLYPTPTSTQEPTGTATSTHSSPERVDTLTPAVLCKVMVSEALNFRSGPGTSNPVIGWLYPGDVLEITQQVQGWANVTTPTGAAGWVKAEFCK